MKGKEWLNFVLASLFIATNEWHFRNFVVWSVPGQIFNEGVRVRILNVICFIIVLFIQFQPYSKITQIVVTCLAKITGLTYNLHSSNLELIPAINVGEENRPPDRPDGVEEEEEVVRLEEEDISNSFRIKFWGLLEQFKTPEVGRKLARRIGEVMEVDLSEAKGWENRIVKAREQM
ncbi:hypothetical protein PIB30_037134 [Stylosanthes scabra]|uniref:Uncharacterized protein n=1 Tax=Stylosanthes scabra TaxID=79078 RepID=A0ABU6QEB5_9FABA|nr:hypothetical protein [Stylosanthes scabra]